MDQLEEGRDVEIIQVRFFHWIQPPFNLPSKLLQQKAFGSAEKLISMARALLQKLEERLQKPIPVVSQLIYGKVGATLRNGDVIGLSLSGLGLTSLPQELGDWFPTLESLYLYHNNFTTLDPSIRGLTKLRTLYLAYNRLIELPSWLGELHSLKVLFLQNNNLTTLPPEVGSLAQLKELRLYNNSLVTIPSSIGNLHNLEVFWLNKNRLREVPEQLGSLRNLRELYLNNNNISALPDTVGNLTNLQLCHISQNNLTTLPHSFVGCKALGKLDVRRNPLGDVEDLVVELAKNSCRVKYDPPKKDS